MSVDKRELKPIVRKASTPQGAEVEKFVAINPRLAGQAIAKWLNDDRESGKGHKPGQER